MLALLRLDGGERCSPYYDWTGGERCSPYYDWTGGERCSPYYDWTGGERCSPYYEKGLFLALVQPDLIAVGIAHERDRAVAQNVRLGHLNAALDERRPEGV
jgi:hypothetical protein